LWKPAVSIWTSTSLARWSCSRGTSATSYSRSSFAEGTKAIRKRFEAVDATQPVELDAEQRARLRTALDNWGSDRLQLEGIPRLHAALVRAEPEP
jgi:hypothetical protein